MSMLFQKNGYPGYFIDRCPKFSETEFISLKGKGTYS